MVSKYDAPEFVPEQSLVILRSDNVTLTESERHLVMLKLPCVSSDLKRRKIKKDGEGRLRPRPQRDPLENKKSVNLLY